MPETSPQTPEPTLNLHLPSHKQHIPIVHPPPTKDIHITNQETSNTNIIETADKTIERALGRRNIDKGGRFITNTIEIDDKTIERALGRRDSDENNGM